MGFIKHPRRNYYFFQSQGGSYGANTNDIQAENSQWQTKMKYDDDIQNCYGLGCIINSTCIFENRFLSLFCRSAKKKKSRKEIDSANVKCYRFFTFFYVSLFLGQEGESFRCGKWLVCGFFMASEGICYRDYDSENIFRGCEIRLWENSWRKHVMRVSTKTFGIFPNSPNFRLISHFS